MNRRKYYKRTGKYISAINDARRQVGDSATCSSELLLVVQEGSRQISQEALAKS